MLITKEGINRITTQAEFERKFKHLGFVEVKEITLKIAEEDLKEINEALDESIRELWADKPEVQDEEPKAEERDLASLKKLEIIEILTEKGIEFDKNAKKEDLIALL